MACDPWPEGDHEKYAAMHHPIHQKKVCLQSEREETSIWENLASEGLQLLL